MILVGAPNFLLLIYTTHDMILAEIEIFCYCFKSDIINTGKINGGKYVQIEKGSP